jgi:myo-inositol-1(or 4)-monophosphatase
MTAFAILEQAARDAAEAGGAVARRYFEGREPVVAESKGLHDFVTHVDHAAEAAIVSLLRERFPDHAIMSEEGSPDAAPGEHRWIVDPLDGTTNFFHGVPTFGISVAVEDRVGLVAGAVCDPLRRETFHAHRGGGARLNDTPIRCSAAAALGDALLATGFPFRELSRVDRYLRTLESFMRNAAGVRRAGAASLDLAYTACGRYDGFWEAGLSRWDVAAGVLLVNEAGGRVSDLTGGATVLDSGDIVAAGASLHPKIVEITRPEFL